MSPDATTADDSSTPDEGRRYALPAFLFAATCLSTLWAGAAGWNPYWYIAQLYHTTAVNWPQGFRLAAMNEAWAATTGQMNWRQGFIYMGLVLGLLLAHEMGHFLMTRRHRIPASLPYFIPLPIIPFGTLGAVIGMEGSRANRREMFDLGIAGPLAGLAVTVPILDGFRREGRIAEQRAVQREAEVRTHDVRDQIAADIDGALLDLANGVDQQTIAAERLKLADEEVAQATDRFTSGVAGSIELINAQATMVRARDADIDARFAVASARVALARAAGVARDLH